MSESILQPIRCDQCSPRHDISWARISHQFRAIWLENPKAGSTSIKMALGVQPKGIVSGDRSNPYGFSRLPLPRDTLLKYDDYFIFGFCRNPWDRMVSTWKNFTTGQARIRLLVNHWHIIQPGKLPFKRFVQLVGQNRPKVNHHWVPQIEFLPVDKMPTITIGRFESFAQSWEEFSDNIGINRPLGHFYRTKHDHYTTYYDDETVDLVRKLYPEDIDFFGYDYGE